MQYASGKDKQLAKYCVLRSNGVVLLFVCGSHCFRGFCVLSEILCVISCFAITLTRTRERVVLL